VETARQSQRVSIVKVFLGPPRAAETSSKVSKPIFVKRGYLWEIVA
jgi:hypothetical protein